MSKKIISLLLIIVTGKDVQELESLDPHRDSLPSRPLLHPPLGHRHESGLK